MGVCVMTQSFKISWYLNGRFETIRTCLTRGVMCCIIMLGTAYGDALSWAVIRHCVAYAGD